MRVLLVDEDQRFGLLLGGFLEEQGWSLQWVSDGREALSRWEELAPELVLTEIEGEMMDGLDFVEEVRRLEHPPPIVLCTRVPGVGAWDESVLAEIGVRAALVRPLRFPELFEILREAVGEE